MEVTERQRQLLALCAIRVDGASVDWAAAQIGARLVTVLDEDYPPNLRLIPNLPPFLFFRGSLAEDDARSVAVVGIRSASPAGIDRSARLSGSRSLAPAHLTKSGTSGRAVARALIAATSDSALAR